MLWAMARWEPDARQRLVAAALDLFTEQGYDDTTVAQIADRAGLTKSTFFRHFPDKREVLVAGRDRLKRRGAVAPERRELGPRLQAVVAANSELQERDALKRVGLAKAMSDALQQRGVPDPAASLAAELGVLAFKRAFARWMDPGNRLAFGDLARQSLQELRAASAVLG
jgi:AcrR family transcriptional regulator